MKSAFRIAAARHRLERGDYDRPEIIAAAAHALLASGDLEPVGDVTAVEEQDGDRWDGLS